MEPKNNNIDFYKTSNAQIEPQLQKENPILNVQLKNGGLNPNTQVNDGILRIAPNLTYEEA